MATYKSIRYNIDYAGKAGSLMPLLTFTSDGSDATADFTSGIDSTYDEYLFIFNNIHPGTDNVFLSFNGSDDTSSHSYDITKTTTFFRAYHNEGDGTTLLGYTTGSDLAESTAFQVLEDGNSNDNDHGSSGFLYLFNPSSTTFVKHFMARISSTSAGDFALQSFTAGYFNTTAAITALQFKMSSGEIQGGTIQMFGVI